MKSIERDLGKSRRSYLVCSYYVLAILIGVGLFYIWNLNTIGKNAVNPRVLQDSTALIKDIPLQSPRVIPPVDIMKVGTSSSELINKGRELFKANCITCHGDNGQGDGPSASMLNPKPRNFHSLDSWKNGSKVTQIYKTLKEGILGGGMASYKYMPPEDRFALIHFIRAFANNQPKDSLNDLKQLDATYQLAKGMNVAGQIPIKKALYITEKENTQGAAQIQETAKQLTATNNSGADLLKRVSFDEKKVVTSVTHMKSGVRNVDDFIKIVSADPHSFRVQNKCYQVVHRRMDRTLSLYFFSSSIGDRDVKKIFVLCFTLSLVVVFKGVGKDSKPPIGIIEKLGQFVPMDIELYDESGNLVQLKSIINKPTIITFVYYKCPGICSPLLTEVAKIVDKIISNSAKIIKFSH